MPESSQMFIFAQLQSASVAWLKRIKIPDIDEQTLKKLPYWKAWLYRTLKEIEESG